MADTLCHCGAVSCEEQVLAHLREQEIKTLKQKLRDLTAEIDSLAPGAFQATQAEHDPESLDSSGAEAEAGSSNDLWGNEVDHAIEEADALEQNQSACVEALPQAWYDLCASLASGANNAGSDSGYGSDDSQSECDDTGALSAEASSDDAIEAGEAENAAETEWQSEWATSTTAWSDDAAVSFAPTVSDDKKVLWAPSAHCRVGAAFVSELLRKAMLSASRTVYRAFDEHNSEECFEKWDCPENVGWGRSEMLGELMTQSSFWMVFGAELEAGRICLDGVVRLRNASCHPCNQLKGHPEATTTEHLDHLLSLAQKLAGMLGNQQEEAVIRALRDDLQSEAQKTWDELQVLAYQGVEPSRDICSKAVLRTFRDYDFDLLAKKEHVPLLIAKLEGEAESRRIRDTKAPSW